MGDVRENRHRVLEGLLALNSRGHLLSESERVSESESESERGRDRGRKGRERKGGTERQTSASCRCICRRSRSCWCKSATLARKAFVSLEPAHTLGCPLRLLPHALFVTALRKYIIVAARMRDRLCRLVGMVGMCVCVLVGGCVLRSLNPPRPTHSPSLSRTCRLRPPL